MARLWDRIAAVMAAEAQTVDLLPHPPATLADIDDALARWSQRPESPTRDYVINHLLDRKLRLQEGK